MALIGIRERRYSMFVIVVLFSLLLFLALAGSDLLVENINSDELSNMGVEKKS
jgi:hypothetical protein